MLSDLIYSVCAKRFVFAVFLVFSVFFLSSRVAGAEGFYLGGAVGGEYSDVDYGKSVTLNPSTDAPVMNRDGDSSQGGTSSFKAVLGHRWNLSDDLYFSGEFNVALRPDDPVSGSIEGTMTPSNPDSDVFPGTWSMNKNRDAGFSVKLGYSPGEDCFLGKGGSVYAVAGVRRLDVTLETTTTGALSDGTMFVGSKAREKRSVTPWLFGGGIEIGSEKSRLDLRITYSKYDITYEDQSGTELVPSIIGFEFEVSEFGAYLGYTWSPGFGLGI